MDWIGKIKLFVFPLCLSPLAWRIYLVQQNALGPDPGNIMVRDLGELALQFLCLTLAVTPARRITRINQLIRFRRMLGLFTLFYAVLHMLAYVAFMLGWQWSTLVEDFYQRPYILIGTLALILLLILGVTSTKGMMRKLGKSWVKLHRLVYLAGVLVIIHFLWLIKSDYEEPVAYGAVIGALLLFRLLCKKRKPDSQ